MIALHNKMRYELLLKQFRVDSSFFFFEELKQSLNRVFSYVYHYTDIMYIEDIDEETLYNFIMFHSVKEEGKNGFVEAIKDVKEFIFFLKNIRKQRNVPNVDLSVKNYIYRQSVHS